jgi:energy-coupling factor transport system ATP-binding protein
MEIIGVRDFSFSYPKSKRSALNKIDLSIPTSDFLLICGPSGCGKTTFVRNLKKEIAPYGDTSGTIYFRGRAIGSLSPRESASGIGFVMQDPDNQLVTDTVWHELAFGLENLGTPSHIIRRRIAETANFFGIDDWFEKKVFSLSGGQKQMLNLAGVMVMQPNLLVLDEPTAQLDPIAAKEFLTMLKRINHEIGTTVIVTEHRLEDILPLADKVLYIEDGKTGFYGKTSEFISNISDREDHPFLHALPGASRIALALGEKQNIPVTVRDGRLWLKDHITKKSITPKKIPVHEISPGETVLSAADVWFRYSPKDDFVLKGLSFEIRSGMITSIVGGNGSGKTTTLGLLAGIFKPSRGKVRSGKTRISLLTQNPKTMFLHETVVDDLREAASIYDPDSSEERLLKICQKLEITSLLGSHPYDLSGGEQQKAAIAKLLLTEPDILLMDEPTKGLDIHAKEELADILRKCCEMGRAVTLVTHDVEFAARYSDICAMIFNGEVICTDDAKSFFEGNTFYTTSANRVSRGLLPSAVTCEDVIGALT